MPCSIGISQKPADRKLAVLVQNKTDMKLTGNIGCQLHLQSKAGVPVKHWIELLESALD